MYQFGNFLFVFHSFHYAKTISQIFVINVKSIDGVLGTRTLGGSMEGIDESTELWGHPFL